MLAEIVPDYKPELNSPAYDRLLCWRTAIALDLPKDMLAQPARQAALMLLSDLGNPSSDGAQPEKQFKQLMAEFLIATRAASERDTLERIDEFADSEAHREVQAGDRSAGERQADRPFEWAENLSVPLIDFVRQEFPDPQRPIGFWSRIRDYVNPHFVPQHAQEMGDVLRLRIRLHGYQEPADGIRQEACRLVDNLAGLQKDKLRDFIDELTPASAKRPPQGPQHGNDQGRER